ncbi:MAG: hypothetical protein HYV60_17780 [Planctomycetia bacterium]|nr:hypothetical protein [Planctomycetia bacterium]
MPYASHRIVGVMELEPTCVLVSPAMRDATSAIRKIGFELADSRSTPRSVFEPIVKVNSARLQRQLEVELKELLTASEFDSLN